MAGRGGPTVKRRAKGRATPSRAENGRTVSEEITVLVNTLRELAAIRSTAEDAAGRILASAEGLLAFADKEEAKKAEEGHPVDHDRLRLPRPRRPEGDQDQQSRSTGC